MKYIRTKDGIFDKIDETFVLATYPPKYELTKNGEHIKYEFCRNCKLADTIEELIDEYVYDNCLISIRTSEKGEFRKIWRYITNPRNIELDFDKEMFNQGIYGAIWTDKGLIYVAKMNDKGELELL